MASKKIKIAMMGIITMIFTVYSSLLYSQQVPADGAAVIRINQIGFYTDAPKVAISTSGASGKFFLQTTGNQTVYTGELKPANEPNFAGKPTSVADFSAFNKPGKYFLYIPAVGYSYPFTIGAAVHKAVAAGTIRAFYYQRASLPLAEKYAGKWHRAAGHPDDKVLIHASAASTQRPEGTVISSSRGWYDAGDYNKYIVNSGVSTATLLSLYEDFPAYMQTVHLNIPESDNKLPDVLDEVLWNLRWMLTMQDPADGGVYHKLTNASFDGMVMPDIATAPRYVVQKGTAAALDFAAVTAQASRIFSKFPKQLPGMADSCIKASIYAYNWAAKNPTVIYDQNAMNNQFKPKVVTGDYGDRRLDDEFFWAAAELYATTGNPEYLSRIRSARAGTPIRVPNWGSVSTMGYYTLLNLPNIDTDLPGLKNDFLTYADGLIAGADKNAYQTVMTKTKANFNWGSNSTAANQGILLIKAYRLSHDAKYLNSALGNLDYLLGRNGTGYAYISGYGSKPIMHPHHRPSVADGIADPVPGLLSGGPNPGMQDGIPTPSKSPDEAFIDDARSYATNEIAINWNAPVAYLANAIEALQKQIKK
ncbi:glycoside hydrolase family 9 protein [Mucilaginibacter glaciei]|uniref:Endoglucanase n=1 Tax=Mucilaginibacter glaciei TaxID=2772109 RepID=A0A926NQB2_9SPHI|nr:glycoside hydrolase family 9 protein [Mucilaginibacter glaciei]MBD1395361.1 glycoside hydrolase family 9 protein [Mucilaginibacter glaciei]